MKPRRYRSIGRDVGVGSFMLDYLARTLDPMVFGLLGCVTAGLVLFVVILMAVMVREWIKGNLDR